MSRHHEPAPADVIADINELAITFYERITGTALPPTTEMHGYTSDRDKALAWDLACDACRHLTEHDAGQLLEDGQESNACADFCHAYKSQLAA